MADAPKDKAKEPVSGEKGFDPTKQPGYQEYPKWVNGIQVASKEEEAALTAAEPDAPEPPKPKGK
jgi:hypothetical protein